MTSLMLSDFFFCCYKGKEAEQSRKLSPIFIVTSCEAPVVARGSYRYLSAFRYWEKAHVLSCVREGPSCPESWAKPTNSVYFTCIFLESGDDKE